MRTKTKHTPLPQMRLDVHPITHECTLEVPESPTTPEAAVAVFDDAVDRDTIDAIVRAVNSHDSLVEALASAIRYVEVQVAYRGSMTAKEIEAAILRNVNYSAVEIACNSVTTLASYDIAQAKVALAKARRE